MALEYEIIKTDPKNSFVVIGNIAYNLHKKSDVKKLLDNVYTIGVSKGYSECYSEIKNGTKV